MIELGNKFLDRYLIEKLIDENPISGVTVWKAVDKNFDSDIAIKGMKIDRGKEKEAIEVAKEEAKLIRLLEGSPHIIKIYDYYYDDDAVYLFMQYAPGGNLRDLLKREGGKLPEERAKEIAIEICEGIAYAHDRDVMHRDLKPENILLIEGVVQIGDFGIARVLEGTRKASTAGVGTSQYIAPEQFDDKYDKRVDIWAIGIILYEMLVGKPPFVGKTPRQIMKKTCDDELKIPQFIDEPFRKVIQKALQKDPDDRYQTADEIIGDLDKKVEDKLDIQKSEYRDKSTKTEDALIDEKKIERKTASEWFDLGFKAKDSAKKLEYYSEALKIDPEYISAWNNKGIALYDLERHSEAIECYDKALEINPEYISAWNYKGVALRKLERYSEAIECYDKALEINPEDASAWYNKGIALYDLERYSEAIECYDKALKIDPEYVYAWNNKGIALRKLERYSEAIECYDKALEINPEYVSALRNRKIALDHLRKSKDH